MPSPSDSLASFCSMRLPLAAFSEMPALFWRTSLPRMIESRA